MLILDYLNIVFLNLQVHAGAVLTFTRKKMGDWDLYLFLGVASIFVLYYFPIYISLALCVGGAAIFFVLVKDSKAKKPVKHISFSKVS